MIPKKIHYCWFGGGEKPALAEKCIQSWRRFCPDWEIIEWSEENFDLDQNAYVRYCYDNKKWAFLSDYVRLAVVCTHGGVYFDTDVELLRPLDDLLAYGAFYSFETADMVNTGQGFGAEMEHPTVAAMVAEYEGLRPDGQGNFALTPCPAMNTRALTSFGLRTDGSRQNLAGAEILPIDFMNPYDEPTGRLNKTENTLSIHWYSKSWLSPAVRLRSKLTKPFHRLFGKDCFGWIKRK
jgi:hypothetical protein